jgi:hypothetical protein
MGEQSPILCREWWGDRFLVTVNLSAHSGPSCDGPCMADILATSECHDHNDSRLATPRLPLGASPVRRVQAASFPIDAVCARRRWMLGYGSA